MRINLAKSAGFCFGVKRAINIAFDTVKSQKNIEMLGDIVHNEEVVKDVACTGIKKVSRLTKGINKTLLIRAHGTPRKIYLEARKLGYQIVDATCPMVKEIHKIANKAQLAGYKIIIVGNRNHDEVKGIVGQLTNKALVIDSAKNIPLKLIKSIKKAAVVEQSTQNIDNVNQIVAILRKYIKEVKFFNTICAPTRIKQQEIRKMPLENDTMIIIGSKNSANTKRLYQISKTINKRTYWVQSKDDLKLAWLRGISSVGITAGASTPDKTTREIIGHIRKSS